MATGITLRGYERLLKRVTTLPAKVQAEVSLGMKKDAYELNAQAVRNIKANDSIGASGGGGGLLGSQIVTPVQDGLFEGWGIFNVAPYAAFVEFGTGSRANPPAEWSTYAATFKGKGGGGNVDDFLLSIVEWVRAKGLSGSYSVKTQRRTGSKNAQLEQDLQVAYPIFLSILRNGSRPHPFLYPAFVQQRPKIIKSIQMAVKRAMTA